MDLEELKTKRDEAKKAWASATALMKKAENTEDYTGSKKAHDEAEKQRVAYLKAEKAYAARSGEAENRMAMSAGAR